MLCRLSRLGCLRTSRVSYSAAPNYEFKDEIKEQQEKLVARQNVPKGLGKVQSWKKPIYYAPHQHVFEQSPDFSFKDGREVHVTSKQQLNYKLDQIRLAKKIVELLDETKNVEKIYEEELEKRRILEDSLIQKRPKAKGIENIA
ncbi:unnamed protein product [Caenorhabditis angaria]|uniref:39S ribosomal protein L52, mitochondrial n=1 Tax=Caenorhabditis angaria TaxID=860376 RepID=A0A9P1I0L3_9PELO|nr:unnamed protein product [Caenorhabditis angaria]